MKYYFYSRKQGFPGGFPIKNWRVGGWNAPDTEIYVDLSGWEILKLSNVPEWLRKQCKYFKTWYYYPENIKLTDCRTRE